MDADLVIQLLSSFEGRQIFPKEVSKEKVFEEAAAERGIARDWEKVPDGIYHLTQTRKGFGKITATMSVEDGSFVVKKGSICASVGEGWVPEARRTAVIRNNILQADVKCDSPTTAGWVVLGHSNNGWTNWQDSEGNFLDIYRKKKSIEK